MTGRIATFLTRTGWAEATRHPLRGDASLRRYERLVLPDRHAMLMDCPPGTGEDVRPFLRMAGIFAARGLSVPAILAEDSDAGLLIIEDLGDDLFARVAAADPASEVPLYTAAAEALARMQASPPPAGLRPYGPQMADLAALSLDWYAPEARDARPGLVAAMAEALADAALSPPVLTHRDFHAENLLWLPDRGGVDRVGIIDFQDAMAGPPEYDLASLIHDPRRTVTKAARQAATEAYVQATGRTADQVATGVAICSAQRSLRILGVFARLCLRDGKTHYPDFIPRTWAALRRDLEHPALHRVRGIASDTLPEPTPERLEAIRNQAGHFYGETHAAGRP
ncbi:aminoglycoside phosphotransferase family protein [Jannaschia sp. M317]|uniref:aminoglycoside phosphotransferase family protein n=1 Tax=Jannaschia sp. M317 TaxID=2867011 RepID=UPI0021A7D9B3|nr:phosphotransferase [Jannaschia sp. M317]UWQ18518.1 phosphotransferase [Jannaschia sp. M317]